MKELVSIIVPVYKVEKYINECINSIINQTYKNIEIILVDDGSPDNSGKICDEYAKKDKRIIVIHKENGGLSDARNYGINYAHGEYIAFVDSDDYIKDTFIEKLYCGIKEQNTMIAQCGIIRVKDGHEVKKIAYEDNKNISGRELIVDKEYNVWNCVVWNKLYNRSIFSDLRFPKGKIHEDEFTVYRIIYELPKIAIINEPLYFYRYNENSITTKEFSIKNLDGIEALKEQLKYYIEKEDIELQINTINKYISTLSVFYVKAKKDREIRKKIKQELNNAYRKYLCDTNLPVKYKIKFTILRICPYIQYKINTIRN